MVTEISRDIHRIVSEHQKVSNAPIKFSQITTQLKIHFTSKLI